MIVAPPHRHFCPSHLAHVVQEMRRLGPPRIRAFFDAASGSWLSREGTHRLRAAKALGIAPVMVSVPWWRSQASLGRARFAAMDYGHVFP